MGTKADLVTALVPSFSPYSKLFKIITEVNDLLIQNFEKIHVGPIARSLWFKYELFKCSGAYVVMALRRIGQS